MEINAKKPGEELDLHDKGSQKVTVTTTDKIPAPCEMPVPKDLTIDDLQSRLDAAEKRQDDLHAHKQRQAMYDHVMALETQN